MPNAMVGESVGYHSFVPQGRRNMTHRINDLALSHSGNTFVIRRSWDQSLEAFEGFPRRDESRGSSGPRKLLPVSLRFGYNSTTSTTASAVVCFQPCRTSFRRVATADRAGGFIHREFACDITKCVSSSIP